MSNVCYDQEDNPDQRPSRGPRIDVSPGELSDLIKKLRSTNISLILKSVRNEIHCFREIDMDGFEKNNNFIVNFISNGMKRCSYYMLTATPFSWPIDFDTIVDQLSVLDSHLINSEFQDKPVEWMLKNKLTQIPKCQHCKGNMSSRWVQRNFIWTCDNDLNCSKYTMPVARGTFFSDFQYISLDKILYSIYYWAACTPPEVLCDIIKLEGIILNALWRRIQNVCRVAIERAYPKFRLCNLIQFPDQQQSHFHPIQLVSIKLNNLFVICAKHPESNLVRLGILIPEISSYSAADLTESWFASGTYIRVCEPKFMELREKRPDLKLEMVTRGEIISKHGHFDENSAFGYLITQLTLIFKDYDSSSITCEQLKLILAEVQWREHYGVNPLCAFQNIIHHIVSYGAASMTYIEPVLQNARHKTKKSTKGNEYLNGDFMWAEEYFYATIQKVDCDKTNGKDTTMMGTKPDVRIKCHLCGGMFETYDFGTHAIVHIEEYKKNTIDIIDSDISGMIKCRHCLKNMDYDGFKDHRALLRCTENPFANGCRICCIRFPDRASFLQHMRRTHFEHECPYRCPQCPFASSFQRDIFDHFQHEHSNEMIILCPLCLRDFVVEEPDQMKVEDMIEVSELVYDHMSAHYALENVLACDHCSLSFVKKSKLHRHKLRYHNPIEILDPDKAQVKPYIVEKSEEVNCIQARPLELFIANKQPNIRSDRSNDWFVGRQIEEDEISTELPPLTRDENGDLQLPVSRSASDTPDSDKSENQQEECEEISKFLYGGLPALNYNRTSDFRLSSSKLIDALSKLNKADGILPNVSILMTPANLPARCAECRFPITCDHFVETIRCPEKACGYLTLCPRAMMAHKASGHPKPEAYKVFDAKEVAYKLVKVTGISPETARSPVDEAAAVAPLTNGLSHSPVVEAPPTNQIPSPLPMQQDEQQSALVLKQSPVQAQPQPQLQSEPSRPVPIQIQSQQHQQNQGPTTNGNSGRVKILIPSPMKPTTTNGPLPFEPKLALIKPKIEVIELSDSD